ncbi:MAG TPA: DHHA1 domain-containing protein [Pyrinomonadaceae bacterium]|nr:DHHA1 domain-containing protein [Pyrinomonadaceae bacterium]
MPTTERLYYHDSRLLEFDARVISLSERDDGQIAVTLDRTAFYPTGGGQPSDTGILGEARVVDCIDAESDGVLHLIQGSVPEIGDTIHGKVDWLRRLDHMQQHTGQHILSAAFVKLFDAPTRSFRVLEHDCEIDVALDDPTDERIEQAVDLANQIIWESRPIRIREVPSEEAAALPLRKEPSREGELRVIEIDDFDLTPCGGTHAKSTGEVGVIAVRSWERAKGLARIQFMAGMRALADYRKANHTAREVGALFSAGREDSPALVARLVEENKKLRRRVSELEEVACRVEAEELLRGSSPTRGPQTGSPAGVGAVREGSGTEPRPVGVATGYIGSPTANSINETGPRVIAKVFDDRDADSLKHLALALIAHPNTVALLGSRDGATARLVFARSSDASGDMNALMRTACAIIEGRGGGKADMAQGGGKNLAKLGEAIEFASEGLQ